MSLLPDHQDWGCYLWWVWTNSIEACRNGVRWMGSAVTCRRRSLSYCLTTYVRYVKTDFAKEGTEIAVSIRYVVNK